MINCVSFGYQHPLKTAYKKGLLPTVKFDIYGNYLNKDNVSLEHIVPHSLGGRTVLDNLLLADKRANHRRGAKPLFMYTTQDMIDVYLWQFRGLKNKYINGDHYINVVRNKLKGVLYEYFQKNNTRK